MLERVRSTSSRLIAMLLDFEEKWEHGSKMKYKHGLSDCKDLDKLLLSYRMCMIRRKPLQGSRTSFVYKATFSKWHCALSS